MSYYQRKGIWYVQYYPNGRYGGKARMRLPKGSTEYDAIAADDLIKKSLKEMKSDTKKIIGQTLEHLKEHYLAYIQLHKQPRTYDDVELSLTNVIKYIGDLNVTKIRPSHINLYKTLRTKEVSNRTVNKELSWLSGLLTWCRKYTDFEIPNIRIEYLPHNQMPCFTS